MKPQVCNICNTVTARKMRPSMLAECFMERRVGMRGTAEGTREEEEARTTASSWPLGVQNVDGELSGVH